MKWMAWYRVVALIALLVLACGKSPSVGSESSAPSAQPAPSIALGSDGREAERMIVRPAPPPDPRSPAEIASAACTGHDGKWLCKKPKPLTFAASTGPIIPVSWTVPSWFVDPANATTLASDTNDCTTAVTPCLTYQAINVQRWGCLGNPVECPRLRQTTSITFLSSQPVNSDLIIFNPSIENGSAVSILGVLGAAQQVASGVLSNVTAKNRATPQVLLAQSGATAPNQLVVNATHPSRAWTYALSSGSIFKMTQPLAPVSIPYGQGTLAEVDTWTNGDSVTVYNPVALNLAAVEPTFTDDSAAFNNFMLYVNAVVGQTTPNLGIMFANTTVSFSESALNRQLLITCRPPSSSQTTSELNTLFLASTSSLCSTAGTKRFIGGELEAAVLQSPILDGDIIVNSGVTTSPILTGRVGTGLVEIESGSGIAFNSSQVTANVGLYAAGNIFWGAGQFNLQGTDTLTYKSGAAAAAAEFLQTGGIKLNGITTACIAVPTAANAFATCNLPTTAVQLDTSFGAVSGCLATGAGAAICNYGP